MEPNKPLTHAFAHEEALCETSWKKPAPQSLEKVSNYCRVAIAALHELCQMDIQLLDEFSKLKRGHYPSLQELEQTFISHEKLSPEQLPALRQHIWHVITAVQELEKCEPTHCFNRDDIRLAELPRYLFPSIGTALVFFGTFTACSNRQGNYHKWKEVFPLLDSLEYFNDELPESDRNDILLAVLEGVFEPQNRPEFQEDFLLKQRI